MKFKKYLSLLAVAGMLALYTVGCKKPVSVTENKETSTHKDVEESQPCESETEELSTSDLDSDKKTTTGDKTVSGETSASSQTQFATEIQTTASSQSVSQQPSTEKASAAQTQPATQPATQKLAQATTQAATQGENQTTQPATQKPTVAPTQPATQPATEAVTQKQTEAATTAPTEAATEAPTREKTAWDYPWDLDAIEAELRAYGESLGMRYVDEAYLRNDWKNNSYAQQYFSEDEYVQEFILTPETASWGVPEYLDFDDDAYTVECIHRNCLDSISSLASKGKTSFYIYFELDSTGKHCIVYTLY